MSFRTGAMPCTLSVTMVTQVSAWALSWYSPPHSFYYEM